MRSSSSSANVISYKSKGEPAGLCGRWTKEGNRYFSVICWLSSSSKHAQFSTCICLYFVGFDQIITTHGKTGNI